MGLTQWLCSLWEVPNNLPKQNEYAHVRITVGMALPPMKNGKLGKLVEAVCRGCEENLMYQHQRIIYSNAYTAFGDTMSVAMRERIFTVRQLGVDPNRVHIPHFERNQEIRNTNDEALYALGQLSENDMSIFIVANHLHMRRVVKTFRKAIGRHSLITLYWKSVGKLEDYGPGYGQSRFRHPLLFLCYEILASVYSKMYGWT